MKYNYHTHTYRCNHAGSSDERYAEFAYNSGIVELGFADHVPQPGFEGIFESWFRMKPEETEGYFNSIRSLKDKYDGKMNILAGFEVEYYPDCFEVLCEHIEPFAPDYFILGQHFTNNEHDGIYVGSPNCPLHALETYVDQVEKAVSTGMFSYLAHPDLPNYSGDKANLLSAYKDLCQIAKGEGIPVECNLLGIQGGRWYPKREFFEVAADVGCDVILGLDAHLPDSFICEDAENNARKMLADCGITPIEKLTLRRPFK